MSTNTEQAREAIENVCAGKLGIWRSVLMLASEWRLILEPARARMS